MRGLFYIVMLIVAAGCCSVHDPDEMALNSAEELLEENPRAAYDRLGAMDISDFSDSATMARWALLYSESMAMSRMHVPTDTIVNIAVGYYSYHGKQQELSRAHAAKQLLQAGGDDDYDALISALYVQKEREYALYVERMDRERYMAVALVVMLIGLGVIVWQRQRLRIQRLRNETLLGEASMLQGKLTGMSATASDMQQRVRALFDERFRLIARLCDTYYETQGTRAERNAIAEQVKGEIAAIKSDKGMNAAMESAVNDGCGGLISLLREQCAWMKEDDCRLMTYLACGFSNRAVSMLMGMSVDAVYKRKSRLRARIKAESPMDMERFLAVI